VERGGAVKRLVCIAALVLCAPALAQQRVVLVATEDSPIVAITALEARKIFLGIAVFSGGRAIRGLRNLTDPSLDRIFLQSLMGLSAERYERRLLSNVLKYGTTRPEEMRDAAQLAAMLEANPYTVTYVRVDGSGPPPGTKILRVLWQDF
jgi:hypothetical protein